MMVDTTKANLDRYTRGVSCEPGYIPIYLPCDAAEALEPADPFIVLDRLSTPLGLIRLRGR